MFIFNTTTQVSWAIHAEWLDWMREERIPRMLSTELFYKFQLVRVREINEDEGPTYAVQFYAKSAEHIERYKKQFLKGDQQSESLKWSDQLYAFSSVMEVIN